MPIQKLVEYLCDLCGQVKSKYRTEKESGAGGWVTLHLQNYLGHREYFDRVVCPGCADKIRPILAKRLVKSDGTWAVYLERIRQVTEEGFDAEHDDHHIDSDLAGVAADILRDEEDEWGLYRKHKKDRMRQLEIAGALVCAEWDRLKRIKDAEEAIVG